MMAFKTEGMRSSMKVLLLVSSDQAPYSDPNPFGGIHTTLIEHDGEPCRSIWPRFGWIMQNLPRSRCNHYSDYIEHVVILGRLTLSLLVVLILAHWFFAAWPIKGIPSYHIFGTGKNPWREKLFRGPRALHSVFVVIFSHFEPLLSRLVLHLFWP